MKNGLMFFLNLGNISKYARIAIIPMVIFWFFLAKGIFMMIFSTFVLIACIVLAVIHAPSDKHAVNALNKFYSEFIKETCDKANVDKEELIYFKTWQYRDGMRLRRWVNGNFIYPYPCIMAVYEREGEQYLSFASVSLINEEYQRHFECKVTDHALSVTTSQIEGTNDEETVHITFPSSEETIDIMVEDTYQNRELLDLLIAKDPNRKIQEKGQGKRNNIEVSDINPVSRARAYGVVKNETFLTRFNDRFSHILFVGVKAFAVLNIAVYIWLLLTMMGTIGQALYFVILICFLWFVLLRPYKRRFRFFGKLKKYAKRNNCRLEIKRKFFESFKYHDKEYDIKLEDGMDVYFIRLMTAKKGNCAFFFDGKNHVQTVIPCPKEGSALTVYDREIYEAGKYKVRTYETRNWGRMTINLFDVNFGEKFSVLNNKNVIKVLIVDPIPQAIHKKAPDGGTCRTGTGDMIEDYLLYTSNSFVEFLKRKQKN